MSALLRFQKQESPAGLPPMFPMWLARTGRWQFLIVEHLGVFTVSYRLARPIKTVSASSTIMGPFATFEEAEHAAKDKWVEVKRLV